MTDWLERGKKDFRDGVPRVGAPAGEGSAHGNDWRKGWDAAETEGEQARLQMADVEIVLHDGRLFLVDEQGRVLGMQTNVVVEQSDDGLAASVSFRGLRLRAV